MPDTYSAWAAILLASALTLATRLSGPIVMAWLPMSPRVERFLQNLSLAVLAALAVVSPERVLQSVVGAVAIGAILTLNHRPGRYLGV